MTAATPPSPSPQLARRVWDAAHITGTFTLRAGGVTDEYFDKYRFEADPALLREICEQLVAQIDPAAELLAGLELGGVPLATLLSQLSGRQLRFVRKAPKEYGTRLQVEGGALEGRRIAVVEDVATSGRSIIDGIDALRRAGAVVDTALCVVDREQGATAALAAIDVELRALFTSSQLRASAA